MTAITFLRVSQSIHQSRVMLRVIHFRIYYYLTHNKIDIHDTMVVLGLTMIFYSTFFNVELLNKLSKTIGSLAISDCGHFEDSSNAISIIQPKIRMPLGARRVMCHVVMDIRLLG